MNFRIVLVKGNYGVTLGVKKALALALVIFKCMESKECIESKEVGE